MSRSKAESGNISVRLATLLHERHQRRMGNFSLIFETLDEGYFSVFDVSIELKISVSGARSFVYELIEFGLVTVVNPVRAHANIPLLYALTKSKEDIQSFLALMEEQAPAKPTSAPKRRKCRGKKFDSLLGDEIRKPAETEIFRHWMDKAIFGDGPAPSLVRGT